jgi:hypothetical protein
LVVANHTHFTDGSSFAVNQLLRLGSPLETPGQTAGSHRTERTLDVWHFVGKRQTGTTCTGADFHCLFGNRRGVDLNSAAYFSTDVLVAQFLLDIYCEERLSCITSWAGTNRAKSEGVVEIGGG